MNAIIFSLILLILSIGIIPAIPFSDADSTIPGAKSNPDNAFTAATFAHKYQNMEYTGKTVSVVIKVEGQSTNPDPAKRAKEIRYLQNPVLKFLSFSNAINVVSNQEKNEITAQIDSGWIPILEKRGDVVSVTVKKTSFTMPYRTCIEGMVLAIKTSNDSPVCLKSSSLEKLIQRGWAVEISTTETEQIHQGYSATAEQYEVDGNIVSNVDVTASLWNPREKSQEQIEERAVFLAEQYDIVRTEAQQERADEAREKYSDAIVINALLPSSVGIVANTPEHFEKALKRNIDAGITVVSASVFGFPGDGQTSPPERILASAKVIEKLDLTTVSDTDSIRQAKTDGKMIVMFNSQGADYYIDDPEMLEQLKLMRMHVANFVYNSNNALAGGGNEQNMGVTELGKEFIQKSNEIGVIVDCSHSSTQTCIDAAKYSQKPTIASHSNAYAIHQINRNIPDEGLIAIGNTGGVVCSVGLGNYLNEELDASPEAMAIHIDYIGDLIGRDKTCFSTDYTHNYLEFVTNFVPITDVFPPEKGWGSPTQNLGPEHVWGVVGVLEDEYDWSEEEIRGFLGENLMRVYDANWN